jgi:hypothetical protein
MKPNKYTDEYQKACTHELMIVLGYTFDEPTGIWIKPGVKELVNGKLFFPNVCKSKMVGKKITLSMINEMLRLRKLGYSYNSIADEIGISDTSVFKYVSRYEGKIN